MSKELPHEWRTLSVALAIGALVATQVGRTATSAQARSSHETDRSALVARGDYITHHLAMCVECHSPRDQAGNIIRSEEFKGAPVLITAPYWRPDWAQREPAIAGLPGFTDEQVVTLLMTGRATDRDPPKRPMPPFRMTREDAEAVVAFLRTR